MLTSILGLIPSRVRRRVEANISSTGTRTASPVWNPERYDLIPADELDVRGKFVVPRVTREGAGAALVAVRSEQAPQIPLRFAPPRVYTAVYRGSSVYRTQVRDRIH